MGRSDEFLFPEYAKFLEDIPSPKSIAFLGSKEENRFTSAIYSKKRDFYDLQLGNWNINSDWQLKQKYDLIVCTRCAYFSYCPDVFVEKCKRYLTPEGYAVIDWGLGDHWRFPAYKIGWVRSGEHEFAYHPQNFLYSCFWKKDLLQNLEVQKFWNNVLLNPAFGYSSSENLNDVIVKEVPKITEYNTTKIKCLSLWKDRPQLYIITAIDNKYVENIK